MGNSEVVEWEKRPGGMLVQKRDADPAAAPAVAPPPVKVRVSYGATRLEVTVASQASFGELKKLLFSETGLKVGDQKLTYKGKERQNGHFLDLCGVKNRSKMILEEDPSSLERRYIERQKNVKMQCMQKAISHLSLDVDKLADQVTNIEESVSNRIKVPDVQITSLIEMFMKQAVILDAIAAQGEASSQKIIQTKRIQKFVETLDALKVSNARASDVVVTTNWETFETPSTAQWEFFD